MLTNKVYLLLLAFLIVVSGCNPNPATSAHQSVVGQLVNDGEPVIRDLQPTTEVVTNCGGNNTLIKHPSYSVISNHSVEWEIGGQVGVGLIIGSGVIPGGIDLSVALDSHITNSNENEFQQSLEWDLPAEPNTVMEYTLMWREVWQPSHLEVTLQDQNVLKVNISYRLGIQSDIVGQKQLSCNEQVSLPTPTLISPVIELIRIAIIEFL